MKYLYLFHQAKLRYEVCSNILVYVLNFTYIVNLSVPITFLLCDTGDPSSGVGLKDKTQILFFSKHDF